MPKLITTLQKGNSMKAYKLLSRLIYTTLKAKDGQGYFYGNTDAWELVDERDKTNKAIFKLNKSVEELNEAREKYESN